MSAGYLVKRLVYSVIVLLGTLVLVFVLVRLAPGDPVIRAAGPYASLDEVNAMRTALGIDRPLYVQFGIYLRQVMTGDLGTSLRYHRPAAELVMERLPATAKLALSSVVVATLIAIPLGIIAAVKRRSIVDLLAVTLSLLG